MCTKPFLVHITKHKDTYICTYVTMKSVYLHNHDKINKFTKLKISTLEPLID